MCIRDRGAGAARGRDGRQVAGDGALADAAFLIEYNALHACLLYTSDAADDLLCVDLGGRRIIKKKK